jgi:Flp pilus assembly protein TadG
MLHWIKKFKRNQKGTAMIETAFILPIFTFMTLALFELSTVFFYSFVLESAMYNVTRFSKIQTDPSAVVDDVRRLIQQQSLGLMDPKQVIVTTNLNINFADDWENAPPEICVDATTGVATGNTCADNDCTGPNETPNDIDGDGVCDIGNPPLAMGNAGDIISYIAFYKKDLYTPGLGYLVGTPGGMSFLDSNGAGYYLISSATVTRNEPQ